MLTRDVELNSTCPNELLLEKHIEYLKSYKDNKDGYEQVMVEYLRMSGMYWIITALDLMKNETKQEEKEEIFKFMKSCQHDSGGVSATIGHDPHILYTLSAIQILKIYDGLDKNVLDLDRVVSYIKSLQQADGSFFGDRWGEVDVRFSFCAIASLSLLGRLDHIDLELAIDFVMSCYNMCDGGFGSLPGSESHAGLIYCSLGSLAIAGQLHRVDVDLLAWWLAERQLPSGGLNGRPEKLPDLCYSWWVLSSLKILNRLHWINKHKLIKFILACQDKDTGGFSDRPGNLVDPFHTLFGIAGLSLLTHHHHHNDQDLNDHDQQLSNDNLQKISELIKVINPIYCMPFDSIKI